MKIIYGLIILSIIVFIHELGHLFAALISGVKVESFSIGFGPVLLHKTFKNIDWRISLIPMGGYCGMKGEAEMSEALENNEDFVEFDKDSLYGVHPLKQIFIAFAGPFANFLTAYVALVTIALTGFSYYAASSKILIATDLYPEIISPAKEAGILSGDVITEINGKSIKDFYEIYSTVALHPDEDITVKILRNEESLTFTVHTILDKETGTGKIGVVSDPKSVLKREAPRYSFFPALKQGFVKILDIIITTFKGIKSLFKGVKLSNSVSGPASITFMLGDTIKTGFEAGFRNGLCGILNFISIICISLFLMNLLPVPVLDGGLIVIAFIEFAFKIHVSPKVRYRIQYIGFAFIGILLVIALIGDFNFFMRLFHEK